MVSTLCHTTIWPDGRVAGLGENDCAPLMATTLIVTTPEPLVGGVGLVGFPLPLEYPLPPQPHIPRPVPIRALAVKNARITDSFLYRSVPLSADVIARLSYGLRKSGPQTS